MDDQNPFQDPRAEADVMRLIRQSYGPRQKYEPPFQHTPDRVPSDQLSVPGPYDAVQPFQQRAGQAVLDYGPLPAQMATSMAMQPVTAGNALGDALIDPSLANVTNAGMQGAMTLGAPLKAAGILGTGMITAAMKDLPSFAGSANAQGKRAEDKGADLPGLDPAQNARFRELQKQGDPKSGWLPKNVRDEMAELRGASAKFTEGKNANELSAAAAKQKAAQRDYDAQVTKAEQMRDDGLKRKRQFSDTEVGKVYEKTGGHMPIVGGLLGGAVGKTARAAMVGGAAGGITAANVPTGYNAYFTDAANPEREAYLSMARELPDGHPRKTEAMNYALSLPEANPVRQQAQKELYDPASAAGRVAFGAIEGAGAGHFIHGATRGGGVGDLIQGVAGLPGQAVKGWRQGMADAQPRQVPFVQTGPGAIEPPPAGGRLSNTIRTNQGVIDGAGPTGAGPSGAAGAGRGISEKARRRVYPNEGSPARDDIRGAYRGDFERHGAPAKPADADRIIRAEAGAAGVDLPSTTTRAKATNQGIADFTAQHGRPPSSEADWQQIFKRGTLGVAAGAGLAASPFQFSDGANH